MNRILQEDIESFSLPADIAGAIEGARIVVTGATGLVGSSFVRCVGSLSAGVEFTLPVRSREKARRMFGEENESIKIVETDLEQFFAEADSGYDYIVHCASPTNGQYMSQHPAETFLLAVESTKSILEYARRCKVKGVVYVSSIEYYGQIFNDAPVTEEMMGYVDRRSPRNSYAVGKQAAEFLACSYAQEYGVPVKSARLTQTFGAGISPDDNRVFAQFARSVIAGRDIVLHTPGRSAKPYCYITDCIAALCFILIKGAAGESYNVATPGTYLTIRELAEMYRERFRPDIEVGADLSRSAGYAPETTVNLNSDKLLSLGWRPRYGMEEMLGRLIDYLRLEE